MRCSGAGVYGAVWQALVRENFDCGTEWCIRDGSNEDAGNNDLDATIVARHLLLVLRYGQATRNVVARASEILLRSGAHLLGVVLNAVDLQSSDYAEYYGRAYNDYYQSRVDVEE